MATKPFIRASLTVSCLKLSVWTLLTFFFFFSPGSESPKWSLQGFEELGQPWQSGKIWPIKASSKTQQCRGGPGKLQITAVKTVSWVHSLPASVLGWIPSVPLFPSTTPVHFQGKPYSITVIQVYAPTTNAKEAEVEPFYEDLQGLLELAEKEKMSILS